MWWPFNIIFGSNEDSPGAIVADAMTVIFAPQRGVERKRMLKELQSILGKDGKNVITDEDVKHLNLPYAVLEETSASDIEAAYDLFEESNRGRNGSACTILSKNGLKQLAKFGDLEEDLPIVTKFGWKVYVKDRNIQKTVEESFINRVVNCLPKYFTKSGEKEFLGVPVECGCGINMIHHAWLFNNSYRNGQVTCRHCETPMKSVDIAWANSAVKKIEEFEAKEGVTLLPKEMKAA